MSDQFPRNNFWSSLNKTQFLGPLVSPPHEMLTSKEIVVNRKNSMDINIL